MKSRLGIEKKKNKKRFVQSTEYNTAYNYRLGLFLQKTLFQNIMCKNLQFEYFWHHMLNFGIFTSNTGIHCNLKKKKIVLSVV